MAPTNPAFSMATNAAAVVPPGVMTSSRTWWALRSLSSTAVPPIVLTTSLRATSRGMPSLTPACIKASAKRATYAGPDPCRAVAASKRRSGSSWTSPTWRKMSTTVGSADWPASLAVTTAEPRPTDAHTFGMTRRIAVPGGRCSAMLAMVTPAATLVTALSVPSNEVEISRITCATSQGFTATIRRSLFSASSRLEEVVWMPESLKWPSCSGWMSLTPRSKPSDSASFRRREPPILPAPIIPTFCKVLLELVEERPLGYALALLRAHLHVARREQEDPVGDGLDVAVERVGQAGAEVHHPPRKVPVHVLEVEDHGLLTLEAVGQVLGVVETGRLQHADARGALVGYWPEVCRRVLVGVVALPAGRGLATEEVAQGGTEGRGALRAAEPPDGRPWLGATRAVHVFLVIVSAIHFLFIFVVVIVIDTEPEPGRDPVQTVPNSHPASLRAHPPLLASARSLPRSLPPRPRPRSRHSCPWRVPRDRSAGSNFLVAYHGSREVSRKHSVRLRGLRRGARSS